MSPYDDIPEDASVPAREVLRAFARLYIYDRATRPIPWERASDIFICLLSDIEGFDASRFKEFFSMPTQPT